MRISNFRNYTEAKSELFRLRYAEVDITTGWLWWKKVESKKVYSEIVCWKWMDSGEFTPECVSKLASAYLARTKLEEQCVSQN